MVMAVEGAELKLIAVDKAGEEIGPIGNYEQCRVVPRWNAGDTLDLSIDADHPRAADLAAPGARVVALHRTAPSRPWSILTSGNVRMQGRDGARGASVLRFSILSDYDRVLGSLLGWVNPAGGTTDGWIDGQGDEDAYWRMTGSAERVALALIAANAHRLSVPVQVAVPAVGRGPQVSVEVRMKNLQEALASALSHDVGIRVRPSASGPGLVVESFVGGDVPQLLRESSGVVLDGSFSITGPTVTRVLVAGPGEGIDRLVRLVVDEALEAEWGVSIEAFRDARDLKSENDPPTRDPALAQQMDARGAETLAEGAPKASASAVLTESEAFRFGQGYRLGDTVTVVLDGAPPITERITEVELTDTADDGLTVTPIVGNYTDSPARAVVSIAAAAMRGVRDLQAGR